MHILQICNDYIGSKVHANLFKKLTEHNIEQTIYCPIRVKSYSGVNAFNAPHVDIIYDYVIKPYHRYLYHIKCQKIFHSLRGKVNFEDIDLSQAATLLSDGGLAYLIYQKYNIPYIVSVRITDYSLLLKLPHVRLSAKKILKNASKIVFVSPTLKKKFCESNFVKPFLQDIEGKIYLERNGIDDFWVDNVNRNQKRNSHDILYVGTMIRRKHPLLLIEAVLELKKKYPDISLNLIGASGGDENAVIEKSKNNPDVIFYHGRVNDKVVLQNHYNNNSLFVLPSENETFGLVYLEALSQNLPVIYTKGEGLDGMLGENNGVGILSPSVDNIKTAIETVFDNRSFYSNYNIDFEFFKWGNIALDYLNIYSEIIDAK